jgi:hypothetical protein
MFRYWIIICNRLKEQFIGNKLFRLLWIPPPRHPRTRSPRRSISSLLLGPGGFMIRAISMLSLYFARAPYIRTVSFKNYVEQPQKCQFFYCVPCVSLATLRYGPGIIFDGVIRSICPNCSFNKILVLPPAPQSGNYLCAQLSLAQSRFQSAQNSRSVFLSRQLSLARSKQRPRGALLNRQWGGSRFVKPATNIANTQLFLSAFSQQLDFILYIGIQVYTYKVGMRARFARRQKVNRERDSFGQIGAHGVRRWINFLVFSRRRESWARADAPLALVDTHTHAFCSLDRARAFWWSTTPRPGVDVGDKQQRRTLASAFYPHAIMGPNHFRNMRLSFLNIINGHV